MVGTRYNSQIALSLPPLERDLSKVDYNPSPLALRLYAEQTRYESLKTNLLLCLTVVSLAKTELVMGNREGAEELLANAEHGHATAAGFLANLSADHQLEIGPVLNELRLSIDSVRRLQ